MNEPSEIRANICLPGTKRTVLERPLTLEAISEWIKLQGFDDYTTNGLIELASKYPNQALPSFRKNFSVMVDRVRRKRRKELNGQTHEVPSDNSESGEQTE